MSFVPTLAQHLNALGRKRVLALDGGGVRGMVTIAFLEQIEAILEEQSGRGPSFRLSDYFDLVGGTSVGSILATLIALGYRVSEIKALFLDWCPAIFGRRSMPIVFWSPRFSSKELKRRANQLFGDRTLESADLKTGLAVICKRVDTGSPWVLTNNPRAEYWESRSGSGHIANKDYRIADVVRASTAAPYYFAPKRIPIAPGQSGLFIDGGVSPYNNPALKMLMLAGIRGYGFSWPLGVENLFLVSVGTGSFRSAYNPPAVERGISALFAAKALEGMIGDSDAMTLTLLQWMSEPRRRWTINSEIGDLAGELLGFGAYESGCKPLLSFIRYDAKLEASWLGEHCTEVFAGRTISADVLAGLRKFDRPKLMTKLYKIGEVAARVQVTPDDFPETFVPVAP